MSPRSKTAARMPLVETRCGCGSRLGRAGTLLAAASGHTSTWVCREIWGAAPHHALPIRRGLLRVNDVALAVRKLRSEGRHREGRPSSTWTCIKATAPPLFEGTDEVSVLHARRAELSTAKMRADRMCSVEGRSRRCRISGFIDHRTFPRCSRKRGGDRILSRGGVDVARGDSMGGWPQRGRHQRRA